MYCLSVTRNKLILISIASVIAIWLIFSPGSLFIVSLSLLCALLIWKYSERSERSFLLKIFIIALCLRFLFSIFYYSLSLRSDIGSDFLGDARGYSYNGHYIAETISNKPLDARPFGDDLGSLKDLRKRFKNINIPSLGMYQVGGMAYINGIFYATFGYSPLGVKFLNCLLGVLSALFIYHFVKGVFGKKPARLALVMVIFFPSLFFWSITGLKDTIVFFLICVMLFLPTKMVHSTQIIKKLAILALILGAFFIFWTIKPYFGWPMGIILGISVISSLKVKNIKRIILSLVLATLVFFIFYGGKEIFGKANNFLKSNLFTTIHTQRTNYYYGGVTYMIYPKRFYTSQSFRSGLTKTIQPNELLMSYLKGVVYFIFSPFPWHLKAKMLFLGYLQSIFTILLLPFVIFGIIFSLRYKVKEIFPILFYCIIITSLYGLVQANIGTAFRLRDIVVPFYLALGAIGLSKLFVKSEPAYQK